MPNPFSRTDLTQDATVHPMAGWNRWPDGRKVKFLRKFVNSHATDPRLRNFVVQQVLLPAGVPARDYPGQAAAILAWVQEHIYYVEERDEMLFSPWRTLEAGYGDCDDIAILVAAMCASIEIPCRLVISGARVGEDGRKIGVRWVEGTGRVPQDVTFGHIYNEFRWPRGAETFAASGEGTLRNAPFGYDPILHGISATEHGQVSSGIQPEAILTGAFQGVRRLKGGRGTAAPSFGSTADVAGTSAVATVRKTIGTGVFSRIAEEAVVTVPVTILAVVATWFAEHFILKRLEKYAKKGRSV